MAPREFTGTRAIRRGRLPALVASLSLLAGLALQPVIAAKPVAPTFVDYAQCANGAPPSTALDCPGGWINGILQASNSHYAEDQVTPQRAEVNVPAGASTAENSHSMTFTYQTRKGSAQTHAYDSLATWNYTQTGADRCQGLAGTDCVSGSPSLFGIPDDPTELAPVGAGKSAVTADHMLPAGVGRQFEMYGGIIDSVSGYTHSCTATNSCNDPSVDDYASITIFYHTTTVPQKVQLLFGGHLAVGSQGGPRTWGLGFGASNISGGPYHIKWTASDGASIGNRDNQIMGSAIIFQDTTVATQVWNTNGADPDTAITDDAHVNIGTVAYDTATLSGNTATAGGTATYYVEKDDASCSIAGATALGTKNVANGVVPNSDNYTFTTAGTYEFWVVYSGDANNNTSTSSCGSETVIVNASPATNTQVKNNADDSNIADGAQVAIGTVAYDTAWLTGGTATAGGTVTYYVEKGDATCSIAGATALGTKAVTNGVAAASDTYTFTSAGTYEFWAVYSGDTFNNGSTSTCLTETVIVDPNSPAPHSTPVVQIKDTFNVTGFTADATGNVLVGLYSAAGCAAADQLGSDASFTIAQAISGTAETSFVTAVAGDYYYKISYAGDPNNSAFSSCVEHVGISITSVP